MANFVKVCKAGEVKAGCGKSIEINGKAVGLFNIEGKLYAINDVCGHRGGPLAEGELDTSLQAHRDLPSGFPGLLGLTQSGTIGHGGRPARPGTPPAGPG